MWTSLRVLCSVYHSSRLWSSSSLTAMCPGQLGLCHADAGSHPAMTSTKISPALGLEIKSSRHSLQQSPPLLFCEVKLAQSIQLFATPWTVTLQAHLPWKSPGKNTGVGIHSRLRRLIKPRSPTLQEDSLLYEPQGSIFFTSNANFFRMKRKQIRLKDHSSQSLGSLCSSAPWTVSLLSSSQGLQQEGLNGKGRLDSLLISIL